MVDSPLVRWVVTVVFVVVGGYYLQALLVRRWRRVDLWPAVDDGLHVVMSVGMVAMAWSWGMAIPVMLYVVVFTAAALWFVARALYLRTPGAAGAADPAAAVGHHGSRGLAWYHAAMMGAMVWMAVGMAAAMSALPAAAMAAPAGGAMPGMPGMDDGAAVTGASGMSGMPGMTGMSMGAAGLWVRLPSLVLAAGFVLAAIWLAAAGLRRRGHSALAGAVSAVMAAGMAVAFVDMAW